MGGVTRFVLAPCARAYLRDWRGEGEDAALEGDELPLGEFGSEAVRELGVLRWRGEGWRRRGRTPWERGCLGSPIYLGVSD